MNYVIDALIIAVCILLSGAWVPLLALKGR